ncbi:hypothetical protein BOTCAL_0524g00050 [Botryotinia calthae]|uniref:Uncharacterized protein n=1 Tax=Botryotinia calthae TaxID=38488 RepID=A0A4Y8CKS2_9HELO|nr:hypothetical protein BOTCAL_0524g00050 [Botryotinia calthae]
MSSSEVKYCEELIAERGAKYGQEIPLSNQMCDACFIRKDAKLTAYGQFLDSRGTEEKRSRGTNNKAAPFIHDRQMSRNTKKISKTRFSPRALAEDRRSSSHKKPTKTDKRSSRGQKSQAPI